MQAVQPFFGQNIRVVVSQTAHKRKRRKQICFFKLPAPTTFGGTICFGMKKNLLRLCLLLTVFFGSLLPSAYTQTCEFRLEMHDAFGDGWTGGVLTVVNAGNNYQFSLVDNIGDGMDSTVVFPVTGGLPLVLNWSPGLFNGEVSFRLYNNDGDLIFQISNPASGIVFLNPSAICVDCLKPRNLVAENVWDTRARVAWQPAYGSASPVGWWVVYGPAGFAPGDGDTLYVGTPKANITGLQPKTRYDFYVQQDCGGGTAGKLAGPVSFETYRTNDVGISTILGPQNSCALGVEAVTVVMRNFGANPQSLVRFNYRVNGIPSNVQQPQDGFFTGILGKDSAGVVAFQTTHDFSAPGEYLIEAWTELLGDEHTANDTISVRIVNRLVAPYSQDFETWGGGWYADTTGSATSSWEFGTPAGVIISAAASGKNAWVTNLDGLYSPNEVSSLNSPCFDFSELTEDPVIEFSLSFDTESEYDGAWLDMSTDDGATWDRVGLLGENLNWYTEDNTFSGLGNVWGGLSDGWVTARHLLDGAAGQAAVKLRFVFEADPFVQREGVGVDDIRIYVPVENDLAALLVRTAADDKDCGLVADVVTFEVVNFGNQPATLFGVAYSLNATAPVVENVSATVTLAPNESYSYTFSQTFDSRDGKFDLRCWTILAGEQKQANDTSAVFVVNHLPDPLPLREDFENGLPPGWTTSGLVADDHNNSSFVVAANLYNFDPSSNTTLPRVGFVGPNDSLSFDYRITDFDDDGTIPTVLSNGTRFDVRVSADCGSTFQTVYTINASNHTPSVGLQTVRIPLGNFAGKAVLISIDGTWGAGDFYFDVDNINLPPLTGSPTRDEIEGLTHLTLQPNPSSGRVLLTAAFEQAVEAQVQVLDLRGRIVRQTNTLRTDLISENFELDQLPDGLYLVRLAANGQVATRKLVLARGN